MNSQSTMDPTMMSAPSGGDPSSSQAIQWASPFLEPAGDYGAIGIESSSSGDFSCQLDGLCEFPSVLLKELTNMPQ